MSIQVKFILPSDDVLRELGRMQVLHGQLDHTLRLAIKRMLDISIDDEGYWDVTKGMSAELRERARRAISNRYGDDEDTADLLRKVLADAERATELRNRALHGVWMHHPDKGLTLQDRDTKAKTHIDFQPPTIDELSDICDQIRRVGRVLNLVTEKLLERPRNT